VPTVCIDPVQKHHGVIALGCWSFDSSYWVGQEDDDSLAVMAGALRCGMNHFDTAFAYGRGKCESLIGRFLAANGLREQVFLATKGASHGGDGEGILALLEGSLNRLQVDHVDLYYIHWPTRGKDLRPVMEALERARSQGKIGAIGVSNFSVEQMAQISEVGKIDAHQLCYNLLWRYAEDEVIPYCLENNIAVVTYSSLAQGILTGKFPRGLELAKRDGRNRMLLFERDIWPHVCDGVEEFKSVADQAGRSLSHLAIRWLTARPGVRSVLIGARKVEQVEQNAAAMTGDIHPETLERLTAISDEVMKHIPDVGNIFRYYPQGEKR